VPGGFDAILDVIGADELNRNITALATKGSIVQVGTMEFGQPVINLGALMGKRGRLIGTVLRARPIEEKIALTRRFAGEMLPLFDTGALKPVIDSRFTFDDIAKAHERMGANLNVGKIVVDL
jgi:NADPH:quinone reductase